jgi:hypothetical protein
MRYFIIDEYGVKHPYPYDPDKVISAAAEALEYVYVAGTNISMEKVLMIQAGKVVHFDPSDENNAGKAVGISTDSALALQNVTVIGEGIMESPGWGLTPDTVYYAGASGVITSAIPVTGIALSVGIAVNANTMRVQFSEPIILT